MVILNKTETTVLAYSRLVQVKADIFDRMAEGTSFTTFILTPITSSNSSFNLDRRYCVDQFHWGLLACVLHPLGGVAADDGGGADRPLRGDASRGAVGRG